MIRAACSAWGSGATMKRMFPSVRSIGQLAMFERMSASPGMLRATLESNFRIDVRPILPTITAPTLVIHARDDGMPVQGSRYLADHISGARLLEVDGADHAPWFTEPEPDPDRDRGVPHRQPCGAAAVPSRPAHRAIHRYRREHADTPQSSDDQRWRECASSGTMRSPAPKSPNASTARVLKKHRRRVSSPRSTALPRHIRCAEALRGDAETLGIEIRAGIHTGNASCSMPTSVALQYTSLRGSAARPAPGKSLSHAPCVIWSSARAQASRTEAASSCVACPAPGNSWRRSPRRAGRIGRGRAGINANTWPSDRDAPLGPRRGGDREARTVGPARDVPPNPGHRP